MMKLAYYFIRIGAKSYRYNSLKYACRSKSEILLTEMTYTF